ncbi:MAG: hypothetical protein AAGD00_07005 [Planctomycetota bacterium]
MGLGDLGRFFSTRSDRADDPVRTRLGQSLERLGCSEIRWESAEASVKRGGTRFNLSVDVLPTSVLEELVAPGSDTRLDLLLADTLGWPIDRALLSDFDEVRPLVSPRVVPPSALSGPDRAMCRRDLFDDLLVAVSVGVSETAPLVRTSDLDAWPVDFDEVLRLAVLAERERWEPERDALDVDGVPGMFAVMDSERLGSSGYFALDAFEPSDAGVLFALPDRRVLLALRVGPGSGLGGLASMVQMTLSLEHEAQKAGGAIGDGIYWKRGARVERLPSMVIEDGDSRRVELSHGGCMPELLEALGSEPPDDDPA